jgi:hypothetical protein
MVRRSVPEAGFGRDQTIAFNGGGVCCSGTNAGGSAGENRMKHRAQTRSIVLSEVGTSGEHAKWHTPQSLHARPLVEPSW